MGPKERELQRRLRVLEHVEKIGNDCLKRRSVCVTPTLVVNPAVAKNRAIACRESPFCQRSHISALSASV